VHDGCALVDLERVGFRLRRRVSVVALNGRADFVAGFHQFSHEGCEFHWAVDLARRHDRSDASASCEQPTIDQALEGLARGRSRHVEAGSHRQLIFEARIRGQRAGINQLGDRLGNLEVQGYGGRTIQGDVRDVGLADASVRRAGHRQPRVIGL